MQLYLNEKLPLEIAYAYQGGPFGPFGGGGGGGGGGCYQKGRPQYMGQLFDTGQPTGGGSAVISYDRLNVTISTQGMLFSPTDGNEKETGQGTMIRYCGGGGGGGGSYGGFRFRFRPYHPHYHRLPRHHYFWGSRYLPYESEVGQFFGSGYYRKALMGQGFAGGFELFGGGLPVGKGLCGNNYRRIRCQMSSGGGNWVTEPALVDSGTPFAMIHPTLAGQIGINVNNLQQGSFHGEMQKGPAYGPINIMMKFENNPAPVSVPSMVVDDAQWDVSGDKFTPVPAQDIARALTITITKNHTILKSTGMGGTVTYSCGNNMVLMGDVVHGGIQPTIPQQVPGRGPTSTAPISMGPMGMTMQIGYMPGMRQMCRTCCGNGMCKSCCSPSSGMGGLMNV